MSLQALRNTEATLKRPTIQTDVDNEIVDDFGIIMIYVPPEAFSSVTSDGISTFSREVEVVFDPEDDVQEGDFLEFNGRIGEVRQVVRPTLPRNQATALVAIKEVHSTLESGQ